jgi:hypothetical protein
MAKKSNKANKTKVSEPRRQARKRRENVRKRQPEAALREHPEITPPLATIRIFPKVLQTGNGNVVRGFVKEDRPKKTVEGRYKMTSLVKHLNIAVGVQTLLTYHALMVQLGSGARAKDELGLLRGGPGNIDYRLVVGRKHLADRTAFESEDEVKRWATNKFARANGTVADGGGRLRERLKAEMEAVRLVFRTYERAQLVLTAHSNAIEMDDDDGAVKLETAYSDLNTHLNAFEALQVAIFADINPAELWLQYGEGLAQTFEFARFVGRINAGLEAAIGADLFDLAKNILTAKPQEAGLAALWVRLRELLNFHFSTAKFDLAIHGAERVSGFIRVSRSTRELSVDDPEGFRHVIMGR